MKKLMAAGLAALFTIGFMTEATAMQKLYRRQDATGSEISRPNLPVTTTIFFSAKFGAATIFYPCTTEALLRFAHWSAAGFWTAR